MTKVKMLHPIAHAKDGAEIRRHLEEDCVSFMHSERVRLESGIRGVLYEMMQTCAHAISYFADKPGQLRKVENDNFFSGMKHPPSGNMAVVQLITGARDRHSRDRANQWAKAIVFLLNEGKQPDQIAQEIPKRGGTRGILALARSIAVGEDETKQLEDDGGRSSGRAQKALPGAATQIAEDDDSEDEDASEKSDGSDWSDASDASDKEEQSDNSNASDGEDEDGDSDNDEGAVELDKIRAKLPPLPPDYFPLIVFARNSHRATLLTEGKVAFTVVVSDTGHDWLEVKMVSKPRPRP